MEAARVTSAHDELASLAADIRAALEWQSLLGAEVLPREAVEPLVAVPIQPSSTPEQRRVSLSRDSTASSPRRTPLRETQTSKAVGDFAAPARPPRDDEPADDALRRVKASSKWAALMEGPPTHAVSGPPDARLVILRGGGSSIEAESMLDRMLVNVLRVERSQVLVFDLARDHRGPSVIGNGVIDALAATSAEVVVVMGTFAASAILDENATVAGARGRWATIRWAGGSAKARVTHHPEAILALAARGKTEAKRETFEDLKAVAEALSQA